MHDPLNEADNLQLGLVAKAKNPTHGPVADVGIFTHGIATTSYHGNPAATPQLWPFLEAIATIPSFATLLEVRSSHPHAIGLHTILSS
ncbi:unnamed protein product [Prunus armeniaca]